jgi:hypothetical protein
MKYVLVITLVNNICMLQTSCNFFLGEHIVYRHTLLAKNDHKVFPLNG